MKIYDICIIGTGPAGLTVANELAREQGALSICVLESGGVNPSPYADRLRDLDWQGIAIKPFSRERVLGGTSSTWSGLSSLLDPIDFEYRPWVAHSGWPITSQDLAPYYEQAALRYGFPNVGRFVDEQWPAVRAAGDLDPEWAFLEQKVFIAPAEPQRFGRQYIEVLRQPGIELHLDSTVVRLEGDFATGLAEIAVTRSSSGAERRVAARYFVLACGSIENARLLLLSTFAGPEGLGNDYGQVGRYLMNHPKNYFGSVLVHKALKELPAYFGFHYEGFQGYAGLRTSEPRQREERVLNSYVRFEPMYEWSDNPAIESFIAVQKKLRFVLRVFLRANRGKVVAMRDYAESGDDSLIQQGRQTGADHLRMMRQIVADLPAVWTYSRNRLKTRAERAVRAIRIRNFMEMAPNPENRVTLANRRDAFGNPLPLVRHKVSALDRRSMAAVHAGIEHDLTRAGWGKLVTKLSPTLTPWPIDQDASHHIGTTRMGRDPATSVVDPECRLHGSPNVYVAGASVFPTSGNANPTFTIVALAIRLAAHLRSVLFTPSVTGSQQLGDPLTLR